jgi:hypothetical protein
MRRRSTARYAGRLVGRGTLAVRLTRWKLIRFASFLLGAFVAFNGVTGLLGSHPKLLTWVSAAVVVALGIAIWQMGLRLAGPRPR